MQFNVKNEIPILLLILIPYALLFYLWNKMPEEVPIHFNGQGVADGWSGKGSLIVLVTFMMFLIYGIFLLVPYLDPRINIEKMGNKYFTLKFWMVLFFSMISSFIVYSAYDPSIMQSNAFLMLMSSMFAILGNYFKTIPTNYFIGIKTPWTLENKEVWNKTHRLGGKVWFAGGILIFLLGFVISQEHYYIYFLVGVMILAIIPIAYSYLYYQRLVKSNM